MPHLVPTIETVADLDQPTIDVMYALYTRYYEGASEDLFRRDLADKSHVIVLRDDDAALRGFSTFVVSRHRSDGVVVRSVFSGDTVVDHRFWGQQALSQAWMRLTGSIAAADPAIPLYWFLVTKGHRTYRFLRAFYRTFYPAFDRPTPPREQALLDMFAIERFGTAYEAAAGIVHFDISHGHLAPAWAAIPEKDLRNPDVRFFLDRNQGYAAGDELVCLAELNDANHRPFTARLFRQGKKTPLFKK